MKFKLLTILGVGIAALPLLAEDKKTTAEDKDMREKVSYAVGMHFANQMKGAEYDFNLDEVTKALKDVLSGAKTKMTDAEAQEAIQKWDTAQRAVREEKRKAEGAANKKKADEFLAENKKKPGVTATDSGLQYKVITQGTGKLPTAKDKVRVHYAGRLIDGTEFDSSYKRGEPAEFQLTQVIKGWTEALQLMPVGSKWQLTIPPDIAYGESGRPQIPPNSVLIFDVELLDIVTPPAESVNAVSGEIIKVPSAEELKKGAKVEVLKEEDVKKLQQQQQNKPK